MVQSALENETSFNEATTQDYIALLKFRVMRLAVFTAGVALVIAPASINPVVAIGSLICIGIGAGAAGALNMWWDSDIDSIMTRTSNRPIPAGKITANQISSTTPRICFCISLKRRYISYSTSTSMYKIRSSNNMISR